MATEVVMPKLGLTMLKGTVIKWRKLENELIKKDDILCEIETDKAVTEVEARVDGILRKILVNVGEPIPVTLPIAIIGGKNENIEKLVEEAYQKLRKVKILEETSKKDKFISSATKEKHSIELKKQEDGFKKISPRARRKAAELGVDLKLLRGSGPNQVVIEKDVISYYQNHYNIPKSTNRAANKIPYIGMRKIIGDRLSQSKFTAPHVYFSVSIDMSKIVELVKNFEKNDEKKISINDFLIFTVANVLLEQPYLNCSLINEEIIYHKAINIGMAVALEEGLIVPVIKNVNKKNLFDLSIETKRMANLARARKLMPDDYIGGTFTISNLGMYDIEHFTSIINPPESAILAVGTIQKKPVVTKKNDEKIEIRSIMKITLSVDHRIIDGVKVAKFLKRLKYCLEFPERFFNK